MTTAEIAAMVAVVALLINTFRDLFSGGWGMSARLAIMENSLAAMAKQLEALATAVKAIADLRTDLKLMDQRLFHAESDIRDLQHGDGYVRGPRGIDKEYYPSSPAGQNNPHDKKKEGV